MWKHWRSGLLGLIAGMLVVFAIPQRSFFVRADQTADQTSSNERWACAMLDFIGHRPGICPVCGMTLQRVTAGEISREQAKRMGVQLNTISEGPAHLIVRAAGAAEYDHRLTRIVIPRIDGRIVRRHQATAGCCQKVAAGEPVVDLYSPAAFQAQNELQIALNIGDERLVSSLSDRFERWNLTPVADAIKAGKAPVDTVTITTPFSGQVLLEDFRMADETLMVGKQVAADTPLLRLVDSDKLTLVIHVPETKARFLREGQPVEVSSDDRGPLPQIAAKIDRVSNEINPEIRTVEVRIYLSGARTLLKVGALVTVQLRAVLGPALQPADPDDQTTWGKFPLIPKSAVLSTGIRDVAWRLEKTTAAGSQSFIIAPLHLGPRLESNDGNDHYVVLNGLKTGDQVATQGAFLIDAQAQLAGKASLLFPSGAK